MVVRNCVLTASLFAALGAAGYYGAGMSAEVTTPVVSTFAEPTAMETKRNLFISGHSLTDRPMPDMLAGIAENAGIPISWNMQYMAGSSIRERSTGVDGKPAGSGFSAGTDRDGKAMDALAELRTPPTPHGRPYDVLLITEQHRMLDMLNWGNTVGSLRVYQDTFIAANPQGTSYFFTSWLDLSDRNDPADWIAYERAAWPVWRCVVASTNKSLADDGRADRIHLVPTSLALAELVAHLNASPGDPSFQGLRGEKLVETLFTDRVHLTPLGNYFIAAVTFSSIYGKAVTGTPPSNVDAARAKALATFAETFAQTQREQSASFGGQCPSRIPLSFAMHYSRYVEETYLRQEKGFWGGKLLAARRLLLFSWLPVSQ